MGKLLIDKKVLIKWNPKVKNHLINKGYVFTKIGDDLLIDTEDLNEKSHVKVNVKCENCYEAKYIMWRNYKECIEKRGKYCCSKCAKKLYGNGVKSRLSEIEIINTISDKLGLDWDLEGIQILKNRTYVSLIDPHGYRYSDISISHIKNNKIPHKFYVNNKYTKYNINKFLRDNSIHLEINDDYKGSNKKIKWRCLECDYEFTRAWGNIQQHHSSCPICGDNLPYPEKFTMELFKQLIKKYNINNYHYQYSPIWIKPKKYDFYFEFNSKKFIIEVDGGIGHGNNNSLSKLSPKESQANDDFKDFKANEHNIEVIRIDAKKSSEDYMISSFLNSKLNYMFDFRDIKWSKCHEFAISNLVKTTCDLWNDGNDSTSIISTILKLHRSTVLRYIKQGHDLKWCCYNPDKARTKSGLRTAQKKKKTSDSIK